MVVHRDGNRMEPAVGADKTCHPTNSLGSMRLLSTSVGRSNTASFALPPACEQSGKAALTSFIGSKVWRCKSATCSAAKKTYKMTLKDQRQRDFWYAAPRAGRLLCMLLPFIDAWPLHRCLLLSIPNFSLGALLPQCGVASVRCCISPIVLLPQSHTLEMWGLVELKQTRNRIMHIPDPQCVYVKHDSAHYLTSHATPTQYQTTTRRLVY